MKSVTTIVLLVFVALTVVYLVVGGRGSASTAPNKTATSDVPPPMAGSKTSNESVLTSEGQAYGSPSADDSAAGDSAAVTPVSVTKLPEAKQLETRHAKALVAQEEEAPPGRKVIAYYFHRTQRCRTCLTMEAYAEQALKDGLSEELESGALEWRAVNVEESEHEHFVKEYELYASELVMVETEGGQVTRSKKLKQIWDLVGDEGKFKTFVRDEAQAYLEAIP